MDRWQRGASTKTGLLPSNTDFMVAMVPMGGRG